MKKVSLILAASVLSISSLPALAQEVKEDDDVVNVTGSIQSDILFPQADATIGAEDYPEAEITVLNSMVNTVLIDLASTFIVMFVLYVLAISISMAVNASYWKQLKDNVE